MSVEVRATRIAEAQINALRGPNRNLRAFERFRDKLADRGREALRYRVTGEHLDKLCVRHLRGGWRVVVAFYPDENTAWVVLVAEHSRHGLAMSIVAVARDVARSATTSGGSWPIFERLHRL